MKLAEMFSLEGYGAVVTGGCSGIGLAITEVLAENGAAVTIVDRDADHLDREVKRLKEAGFEVRGIEADVSDTAAMRAAFADAASLRGRIDVVFANAGIGAGAKGFMDVDGVMPPDAVIEDYDLSKWDMVMETNLRGVFITIQEAARHMKPRRSGRIIVTSSVTAVMNPPMTGIAYPASKAAVAHLVRSAALELVNYNILVNAIAPGTFATPIGGGGMLDPENQRKSGLTIPIGRFAEPSEIKGLALFLASQTSSYLVGAQILIDGGLSLGRLPRKAPLET